MIIAGEAGSGDGGGGGGSLAGELADMSLSQVRTRAKSAGVDAETLEGVLDEEDPKAALIAVILKANGGGDARPKKSRALLRVAELSTADAYERVSAMSVLSRLGLVDLSPEAGCHV